MTRERYTAINPVTGDILKSKPSNDVYMSNFEIIQQNSAKNSVYTCGDCATIPCVFPERETKCSFFEPKATGSLLQRDFSDSHPIPEYVKNAPELKEEQMKQFEDILEELHKTNCEILLPSECNNVVHVSIPDRYLNTDEGTPEYEVYQSVLKASEKINKTKKFKCFTIREGVVVDVTSELLKGEANGN